MGEDKKQEAMRKALMEFVQSIDNVGGVILLSNGLHVPVIDEDWIDLGEAYVEACKALGRGPRIAVIDDTESEDDDGSLSDDESM